jgi:hypothetical protein
MYLINSNENHIISYDNYHIIIASMSHGRMYQLICWPWAYLNSAEHQHGTAGQINAMAGRNEKALRSK